MHKWAFWPGVLVLTQPMTDVAQDDIAGMQLAGDDLVVPFYVEPLDVRGRSVQLGEMLDKILARHDYPTPVAALLGELVVLTVLLGTSLKFDGNFILQTQSEGPVSLVVVDFSTPDAVRAYARFDETALQQAIAENKATPRELLGHGVLAMTIDQGENMQRYQGIVALDGISLEEAAHQYFKQSEQIPTRIRLAVAQIMTHDESGGGFVQSWRAGGIISQFLPEVPDRIAQVDLPGGDDPQEGDPDLGQEIDDAWTEAGVLMDTIGDDELTDPQITVERLLFRLFNEHGVRVYEGIKVLDQCTCSREKVVSLVRSFADDGEPQAQTGEDVTTKCEFCGTSYTINPEELA